MDCIDPRQLHWFDVMISNDNPLAISKNWMKNTWAFQPGFQPQIFSTNRCIEHIS
jgi:hypothetical protein